MLDVILLPTRLRVFLTTIHWIGLVTSMVSVALTTLFSTNPAAILAWHVNDVDKIVFARSETTGSMVWRGLARFRS